MKEASQGRIDRAVWAAHLRTDLRLDVGIDALEMLRWANTIISEARGYWHGASGRLAERLEITDQAWSEMALTHRPGPAENLGDSSVDLVPYILARVGLMTGGAYWHQASQRMCAGYFERGREVGCHRADFGVVPQ